MVEQMYTPEEAAEILGFKKRTIMEWLRNGKIRGVKMGKEWRITETELNRIQKEGIQGRS